MIKTIIRFYKGYLVIEIRGNALERFINQIINQGIYIWDLNRIRKDYYLAKIYREQFNLLRPIVRKRRCRVKIKKKIGLPTLLRTMKRRAFLIVGLLIIFLIFHIGSSFIWFINIDGLDEIDSSSIYNIIKESGISRGVLKSSVDIKHLEKQILIKLPKIAWVDVSLKGTELYIEIVEKKTVKKDTPGDITAAKDGIITELIVLQGIPVVKEGETVIREQPLILADKKNKRARGIVNAYVWYEALAEEKIIDQEIIYTGNKKSFWGINIGQKELWLVPIKKDFTNYSKKRERKSVVKWRNINFPIELIKEEHKEVILIKKRLTKESAIFLAKEKALKAILKRLNSDAVIHKIKVELISITDSKVKIRLLAGIEENIASFNQR